MARAETGHPAPSFHGLTTDSSGSSGSSEDEATTLRTHLLSLGGKIPGGRWGVDVPHLRKKIAALENKGGDGDGNVENYVGDTIISNAGYIKTRCKRAYRYSVL